MAEFLDASVRRGVAGGRGGSERRRRVRSGVAWQRAEEGEEEAREGVRGVQGVAWRCGRRPGGGGGSQAGRSWPPRPRACEHAAAPTGKRKTTGGEVEMGWAVLLGQVGYQVSAR